VAFSPDGRRLASVWGTPATSVAKSTVSKDPTVRVWDAASGQELLTFNGHRGDVYCVAFSPDGTRLASGGQDETVRVWDAATGQEMLTLKGHRGQVNGVAFSPNGWLLASASHDRTVRVWKAFPVRGLVNSLFEKLLLQEEVLDTLRKDPNLDAADREFALQDAQAHGEDCFRLNDVARQVVKARDAGKVAYALALRQAEAADRLAPSNGLFLNTLGIAQYRVGRYADALATLTKSEKLNATKEGSHPVDLAFLAMTRHRLGQGNEAKAILTRLRELLIQERWAKHADAAGFLREAEELIEGKAAGKEQ
jgi:hypothetical protein